MINKLKKDKLIALKEGNKTKSNILGVVIGQVQQLNDVSDDKVHGIIRKLIKSNEETMQSSSDESLQIENNILQEYLPTLWTEEQIESFIIDKGINISDAKNEGQAMGMAMKELKSSGAPVEAVSVKSVVNKILGENDK